MIRRLAVLFLFRNFDVAELHGAVVVQLFHVSFCFFDRFDKDVGAFERVISAAHVSIKRRQQAREGVDGMLSRGGGGLRGVAVKHPISALEPHS